MTALVVSHPSASHDSLSMTPSHVPHPAFDLPDAEALVWRGAPELPPPPAAHLDPLSPAGDHPRPSPLSRQEELALFVRLNYARLRAATESDPDWAARVREMEDAVVRWNVGLVVMVSRTDEDAASEGYAALLKAARHFDVSRGWKFSTYAVRCIKRSISRWQTRRAARAGAVLCPGEESLATGDAARAVTAYSAERRAERERDRVEEVAEFVARELSPEERHVLSRRLCEGRPPSFRTIGREVGLTGERARQMYEGAIARLREEHDIPCEVPPHWRLRECGGQ